MEKYKKTLVLLAFDGLSRNLKKYNFLFQTHYTNF